MLGDRRLYIHAKDSVLTNGPDPSKKLFMAFPWVVTSTMPGGFMICVFIIRREHPKAHRQWFYGKAGN